MFHIDQIRRKWIFLRRVDTEHHPDRHAARALQYHITGSNRCDAINAVQFDCRFRELLRVKRAMLRRENCLWHQAKDVVLQLALKAVHH
ncbi:Uncharacterised protein [Shigella sonnei]|nr:Uncharacterised protein [Shigella sonnei]